MFDLFTRPLPRIVSESLFERFAYLSGFCLDGQVVVFFPRKGYHFLLIGG